VKGSTQHHAKTDPEDHQPQQTNTTDQPTAEADEQGTSHQTATTPT
jgi:hypothetical protein